MTLNPILLGCPLLLAAVSANAEIFGDFIYSPRGQAVAIIGYRGSGGAVMIPDNIAGLPVTVIDEGAFRDHAGIVSVSVPSTITRIDNVAFISCIGLTSINIPEGVTNIGLGTFSGCTRLPEISIPASVTSIGPGAFHHCSRLSSITVATLNSRYSSADGMLFNKDRTTLIQCPGGRSGSVTVPPGVTEIGERAFRACAKMAYITIPTSVTNIGTGAFYACTNLTRVIIPNSVNTLGHSLFLECSGLIGVTIPDSVTNLPELTFGFCRNLSEVTIPEGVRVIGGGAFEACTALEEIGIPASVIEIGFGAFSHCSSLSRILVDGMNSRFSSADGLLFDKAQTTLILCPGGKVAVQAIPSSVTHIGDYAFLYCSKLAWLVLPIGVTTIGDHAFNGCAGLSSVTFPASVTELRWWVFDSYCARLKEIYFQGNAPVMEWGSFGDVAATAYYLPGTQGWSTSGLAVVPGTPQVRTSDADFGVRTNQFGFAVGGRSGLVLTVEVCSDIQEPRWAPLTTNVLASGSFYFSDPDWTNTPARFYRVRSP